MMNTLPYLLIAVITIGCSSSDEQDMKSSNLRNPKGEYIYRKHNESFFNIPEPQLVTAKPYPWESASTSSQPKITKEHFRCRGNSLNPTIITKQNNETVYTYDCGGTQKHTLPVRNGKEFIYPILIDLLNYIQEATDKKVIVTCGHRCPEHNKYVDQSPSNQYSKHMIGAEVAFYVQGMENSPEKVVELIQQYYNTTPPYQGNKDYTTFTRYDKSDAGVSTQPWLNKEVFIKIYSKFEGRNLDNKHPHPYVSIQVRYDRDLNEKVTYSWEKAVKNYHRK